VVEHAVEVADLSVYLLVDRVELVAHSSLLLLRRRVQLAKLRGHGVLRVRTHEGLGFRRGAGGFVDLRQGYPLGEIPLRSRRSSGLGYRKSLV